MDYETYKNNYSLRVGAKISSTLGSVIPEYEIKLNYYLEYYQKYQNNITHYINEIYDIIEQIIDNMIKDNEDYDYGLFLDAMILLQSTDENKQILEEYDSKFYKKAYSLISYLEKENFNLFWMSLLKILDFRNEYFNKIHIGVSLIELSNLKHIFIRNKQNIMNVTSYDPKSFLRWSNYYFDYYNKFSNTKKYSYGWLGVDILTMCITCCKNNNLLKDMSNYIYQIEKLKTSLMTNKVKKCFRFILDVTCGYGEKPIKLLNVYILLAIIFTFIYSVIPGISQLTKMSGFNRIVGALYFYNTTSLTIGYGDIIPSTITSMIVVMFNQILGFVIGGSFVSLFLRKIFRY